MPPKRLTANPKAPLRYRPGKAVGTTESSSSESDSDSDADTGTSSRPQQSASKPPPATSFPSFNTAEAEARKRAAAAAAAAAEQSVSTAVPDDGFVTASESEDGEAGSSQDETSGGEDIASSESESSSEDDAHAAGRPKFVAPKFISKANRAKLAVANPSSNNNNNHDPDADADTAAAAAALRQRKADELLEAQIKRDAAARAASQRAFDDDETNNNNGDGTGPQVDDTDGLDAEAEFAAWKLRELLRLQRDRDALVAADRLREETDAYRAMTEQERAEVDGAKIAAQNAAKEARGKAGFMARYHHKGAFFQADDSGSGGAAGAAAGGNSEDAEREEMLREIRRRDLMGAKFQDDSAREILPEYMQIRDMTKLGRKGRTKYKDLRNEDTGTWGREECRPFQSQDGYAGRREDDAGPTGANSYAVGERRPRSPGQQSDYGAEKRSRRE